MSSFIKKAVVFIAVMTMFFLVGCGNSKQDEKDIDSLVDQLMSTEPMGEQDFKRAAENPQFVDAVVDKLKEYENNNNFHGACSLIRCLESYGKDYYGDIKFLTHKNLRNDRIREQFHNNIKAEQKLIFVDGDFSRFLSYYREISYFLDERKWGFLSASNTSYYASFLECFPYEDLTQAIRNYGEPVICDAGAGGYYDTHLEEPDDDYWYSPLTEDRKTKGEVGYQHITVKNLCAGDFDVVLTTAIFYQTSANDPGNSVTAELYYKGKLISTEYASINLFLEHCTSGNTFVCFDNAGAYMFFAIEDAQISTFKEKEFGRADDYGYLNYE